MFGDNELRGTQPGKVAASLMSCQKWDVEAVTKQHQMLQNLLAKRWRVSEVLEAIQATRGQGKHFALRVASNGYALCNSKLYVCEL